jgi:hypothetical protein
MDRRKISFAELRKHIIEQTTKAVGANARFVEAGLEIRPRDGTPNWDANISIAPAAVVRAFAETLGSMKKAYDIAW